MRCLVGGLVGDRGSCIVVARRIHGVGRPCIHELQDVRVMGRRGEEMLASSVGTAIRLRLFCRIIDA